MEKLNNKLFSAFLIKDFLIEKAYRMHFLVKIASAFLQLAVFFYLGRMISPDYFPFLFIGILFSRVFDFTITSLTDSVRQEQHWGTLESIFLAPVTPVRAAFLLFTPKLVLFALEFFAYLALGVFVFGLNLAFIKLLLILFFFAVVIMCFYGLGLLNAAYVLAFKRGDPAGWLMSTLVGLLSGVYFPVSALPAWLVKVSYLLPTTYALSFIRKVSLENTFSR